MIKMTISDKFKKFAAKTTKGKFDAARKAESMAGGCSLPVGTTGVAVVSDIVMSFTKDKGDVPGYPIITIKLGVETPEESQGVTIDGSGLIYWIKDSANQTEDVAWQRFLDDLEDIGLPREIRMNYEDIMEIEEWFKEAPRKVSYTVIKDTFAGNKSGKRINMTRFEEEVPAADDDASQDLDPNAVYVMYLSKPHKVIESDSSTYTLESLSGRVRAGVPRNKVTELTK